MIAPHSSAPEPAYLSSLNPPQRDAVLSTEGPVLVLAGAGTGKTRTLTARLAHLLTNRLAWPEAILAVTFTNKAASEMQQRISSFLGGAPTQLPWLGTFHAVAARMLRRHAPLVGLETNFTILDTDDQLRVIKSILLSLGIDEKRWPARLFAGLIDQWKNRALRPEGVSADYLTPNLEGHDIAVYKHYQDRLRSLNACDFGDLIVHMITIFQNHPDVLATWQQRFVYCMVDEYQDTNVAQYLWLRLLTQSRQNICCVGDEDQSVYGWRGAEIENILRFERDFPGARTIRLEQNYRSGPHILAVASHVIAANTQRLGKTLWTEAAHGEPVRLVSVWDGGEEARWVAQAIERLEREGESRSSMAILVRASHQTREFEERFLALGMPYRVIGGLRFYERQEIRDALAYLRLIVQPSDDLAFERIINLPRRGLGDKSMRAIHDLARTHSIPLLHAAARITEQEAMPPAARRSLAHFVQSVHRWQGLVSTLPHPELTRMVLEESGYVALWQKDKSPEAAGRVDNLNELLRAMEDFATLHDFLEHVALVMDNNTNDAHNKIVMMTLHAAKGLEFDTVFLPGWEEGLFPNQRALDEKGDVALEEERRLAYVGITRARHRSIILNAANRRIFGQWQSARRSRFLEDLPAEHISLESTLSSPHASAHNSGRSMSSLHASASRTAQSGAYPHSLPRRVFRVGERVFHTKFGYGLVGAVEGNTLQIHFDTAGFKNVVESFIERAP